MMTCRVSLGDEKSRAFDRANECGPLKTIELSGARFRELHRREVDYLVAMQAIIFATVVKNVGSATKGGAEDFWCRSVIE